MKKNIAATRTIELQPQARIVSSIGSSSKASARRKAWNVRHDFFCGLDVAAVWSLEEDMSG
jgi:hypothetical protein